MVGAAVDLTLASALVRSSSDAAAAALTLSKVLARSTDALTDAVDAVGDSLCTRVLLFLSVDLM